MKRTGILLAASLLSGLLISGCAYEDYLSSDSSVVKTTSAETTVATENTVVEDTAPKAEEKTVSIFTTNSELNIRSGVGTSNGVIYVAKKGERLEMTGNEEVSGSGSTWYEVITPSGNGWCSGNYGTVSEETVTVDSGAEVAAGADLKTTLIGTYKGVDGSVLTFLADGTADYYFRSDDRGVLQGQEWSVYENRVTWKYNGQYDIYADVNGGDVSSLTFKCDESVWTDEQYTKVSNEAAHWTIEQCDAFLDGTASASVAGTTANATAPLSKEEAIKQALSGLTVVEDEIEQIKQYKPSVFPQYSNSRTFLLPFIGEKNGRYVLAIRYNYYGSEYLGWDKLVLAVDDARYEKKVDWFDVKRDFDGKFNSYEVYTLTSPKEADIALLREIANSTKTIIRFKGDNTKFDFTVPEEDKKAINEVLDAYDIIMQNQ